MKRPKTQAERVEYLKQSLSYYKITPKHNQLVPEWICAEMLHLTPEQFLQLVILDNCPLRPVHKAGARFYRLEDIAEFLEFPE